MIQHWAQNNRLRSSPFSPTDISGLALWLDASDAATITLDGSNNVSQWNDKSGNGRNVTQGTTTTRPSYRTSDLNGQNVVRFDGTDDRINAASYSLAQPTTHFIVLRPTSVAAAFSTPYDGGGSTRNTIFLATNTASMFAGTTLGSVTVTANTAFQATGVFNGASSEFRTNRTSRATGNAGSATLTDLRLGANQIGAAFYAGDIAEFLIYSRALTAGEITSVESYLSAKWGTP